MAEGILSFCSSNSLTSFLSRDNKTKVHLLLEGSGATTALIGIWIQFSEKSKLGLAHWDTPHGIIGEFL